MSTHVMVDLETLATRPDAAVIQIAALAFDPALDPGLVGYGAAFNVFVSDFEGRYVDPQTVAWWMRQKVAPWIGQRMSEDAYSLPSALKSLHEWYAGIALGPAGGVAGVWSHGATFDLPIIEHAYAQNGMKAPWPYRLPRDTRTLYALTPGGMPEIPADPECEHDAVYDCERQVATVVEAVRRIRAAGLEVSL
jgi:hypothetical protein